MNSLKAEFRKLLTVRSTYFIVLVTLAITILVAGYGNGIRIDSMKLHDPSFLTAESGDAILFNGIIVAIAGLLLVGHEYRYNTILYTLTNSNSRVKSLLAKGFIASLFALVVTTILIFFSPLCTIIGTHLVHKHIGPQSYHVWSVLWQCLFVGWGYMIYGLIIASIIRSQVGAIVTFLLIPLVGEHIIEAIFKSSPKYLPFNSLQSVINIGPQSPGSVSTAHNVITACIYIAVGLVVSLVLFARRDAN